MLNMNKQEYGKDKETKTTIKTVFGILKDAWHNPNFLKYLGSIILALGVLLCLFGVAQSMAMGLNLGSPREEICKVVTKVGIGLPLMFAGINIVLKPERRYVYLIAVSIILSLVAVAIFHAHYVDEWYKPLSRYAVCSLYAIGTLSLIGILLANTIKKESEIEGFKAQKEIEIEDLKTELADLDEKLKLKAEIKPDNEFLALRGKLNQHTTKMRGLQRNLRELQKDLQEVDLQDFLLDIEDYGVGVRQEKRALVDMREKLIINLLYLVDRCEVFLSDKNKKSTFKNKMDDKTIDQIESIYGRLQNILKDEGVLQMGVEVGEPFNPLKHEGEVRGSSKRGLIVEILRKGYLLESKVIRKAEVVVE